MQLQIDERRLVDRFLQMVQIDSPSSHEQAMADFLIQELEQLGFQVEEDNSGRELLQTTGKMAGASTGRITGNLIARKKGTATNATPLLFAAHMDTVASNRGIKPQVTDGVIKTDGTTILGADDKAGIAALLEAAKIIEEKQLPHGPLEFIFTIAEETGLNGARLLEKEKLQAKFGFVMDSGGPPHVVIGSTPSEINFSVKIYGKAAHSGVNPEDGISAIAVAGLALSNIRMGRIDEKTTVNIGVIKGGEQTNVVCDYVELLGEVRSRDEDMLSFQLNRIQTAFAMASEKFGARYKYEEQRSYSSYELTKDDEVVQLAFAGLRKAGLQPELAARGGGSDTNIFNEAGIPAVNLGVGAANDHTKEEFVKIQDLVSATKVVLGIIAVAAEQAESTK